MEINRIDDAGREAGRRAGSGIENADPTTTQIGKKILTDIGGRKLSHGRVIESAADDGAASHVICAVAVEEDRASERWIARRTFGCRPAVVRTGDAIVDFFIGRLADIVNEEAARAWLKRKGERVAEAKRPDRAIVSGRAVVKGVVGRDGAVGIDAQHLPEQIRKSLRVCAVGVLPNADVELARRARNESRRHCGWWQS